MNHWSFLEASLNEGIGVLLGMNDLETTIATLNMDMKGKINVIKTAVNLKSPRDWAASAVQDISAVQKMSELRNMVAHTCFGSHESGGVIFLTTKARGKLKFPETIWSPADFEAHFREMDRLYGRVKFIIGGLRAKPINRNLIEAIARALEPSVDQPSSDLNHMIDIGLDAGEGRP